MFLISSIVDECAVENGGCAHICQDVPFLYSCSCHEGFTLDDDKHNCTGDNILIIIIITLKWQP